VTFVFNDGGRAAAGYKGRVGDCVCRAIAIATAQPYQHVFENLTALGWFPGDGMKRDADGLYRPRPDNERLLIREALAVRGWRWTPTMQIGCGCQVHLRADELPTGRLIVKVTHHLVAVIDGVIYDTYDCSRRGTRCVYGFWSAHHHRDWSEPPSYNLARRPWDWRLQEVSDSEPEEMT
jgi:hypothetical protein